jgi:hypothetical protein
MGERDPRVDVAIWRFRKKAKKMLSGRQHKKMKQSFRRAMASGHLAGRSGGRIAAVISGSATVGFASPASSAVLARRPCLNCIVRCDASLSESAVMVIVGKFAPAVGNTELPAM